MAKFKPGDRIVWNNNGNPICGTVIETPDNDPLPRPDKVWAIWDDDNREAHIEESSVKLIPESPQFNHNAWTKFILDNAEEIREIPGKHYALIRKAFEAGFNSKG